MTEQLADSDNQATELVQQPRGDSGVIRPIVDLETAQEIWNDYLALEDVLLGPKDYLYFVVWTVGSKHNRKTCATLERAKEVQHQTGGEIERVKIKSAYRKMAVFFGLTMPGRDAEPDVEIQELSEGIIKIERGDGYVGTFYIESPPSYKVIRAEFTVTVEAPNGRGVSGYGSCSSEERGFAHPSHDIPSTAFTRALNRAIADMIGMGDVSAEEIMGAGETREILEGTSGSAPTSDGDSPGDARSETEPPSPPSPPSSGPRNLGEFLSAALTDFDLTLPEVLDALEIEGFDEIDDWRAALAELGDIVEDER